MPLCSSHPVPELEYVISNSGCKSIVSTEELQPEASELAVAAGINVLGYSALTEGWAEQSSLLDSSWCEKVNGNDAAMLTYTSGTTGRPKGVPTTHSALLYQIQDMCESWKWEANDRILHCLPLHHAHGIVAKLCCPLSCGACVEFIEPSPKKIIERLSSGATSPPVTVFMGVPTLYAKLIEEYDNLPSEARKAFSEGASKLRLMVSGSAALPESVM